MQGQAYVPDLDGVRGQRRFVERGVGAEHLRVYVAEGRARCDAAQFGGEGEAGGAVDVEGLGLAAGAVEGGHQGGDEPFTQGVAGGQGPEFGGEGAAAVARPAAAGVQPVLGALLQSAEPEFGQLRAEPGAEFAVREPVEEFPAPPGQRLLGTAQPLRGVAQRGGGAGPFGDAGGRSIVRYAPDGGHVHHPTGPVLIGFKDGQGNLRRGEYLVDGVDTLEITASDYRTMTWKEGTKKLTDVCDKIA